MLLAPASCHWDRRLRSIVRGRKQTWGVLHVFSCFDTLVGRRGGTQISQISQTHHHSIYKAPHTLVVLSWGVINLPLWQCCAPLKVHQNTAYLAVATFAGAEIAASRIVLSGLKSSNESRTIKDHMTWYSGDSLFSCRGFQTWKSRSSHCGDVILQVWLAQENRAESFHQSARTQFMRKHPK